MKIGIDARFYGSIGKGLGRYTQKLIEHLEIIDTENEYFIFLRQENFEEYRPKNKNFHKVPANYRWYSFGEQILFPIVLMRYRLDVMHFPHFNIPLLYRGKFMVTIHDLILLHFPTQKSTTLHPFWYKIKFLSYRFVIWWAIHHSEQVLTVSEYTKRDILKHYAVPEKKITVSYEAANPFCFYVPRDKSMEILRKYNLLNELQNDAGFIRLNADQGAIEARRKAYLSSMVSSTGDCNEEMRQTNESYDIKYGIIKPYLLYVGNAYPHKNLEALVEMMKKDEFSDITLVLVGKEDYFYLRIKNLASGVENIFFAGFVPDDELDVLYRFGRAYVFPSLYEGFGLPPLEAMGKGLPVLCAHTTSMPEILGDAALYFYPDKKKSLREKIREIWDDKMLRDDLQIRGYAQIKKFQWHKMAKETLEIYRSR